MLVTDKLSWSLLQISKGMHQGQKVIIVLAVAEPNLSQVRNAATEKPRLWPLKKAFVQGWRVNKIILPTGLVS